MGWGMAATRNPGALMPGKGQPCKWASLATQMRSRIAAKCVVKIIFRASQSVELQIRDYSSSLLSLFHSPPSLFPSFLHFSILLLSKTHDNSMSGGEKWRCILPGFIPPMKCVIDHGSGPC